MRSPSPLWLLLALAGLLCAAGPSWPSGVMVSHADANASGLGILAVPVCDNGVDDDGDGYTDSRDPSCSSELGDSEENACSSDDFLCGREIVLRGAKTTKLRGRGRLSGPWLWTLRLEAGRWTTGFATVPRPIGGTYRIVDALRRIAELELSPADAQAIVDERIADFGLPPGTLSPLETGLVLRARLGRRPQLRADWVLGDSSGPAGSYRIRAVADDPLGD
jgi:hypothetical protein